MTIYVLTLCPTLYIGDSGELAAVAECFGVAHPPGYPLFTLLHGALVWLLPFGEVAFRANLITACFAAAAIAVVYLVARRLGSGRASASAAAIAVAVARPFWSQAVAIEVYAMDALLLGVSFAAAARMIAGDTTPRHWLQLGVAFGLCCGHRPTNLMVLLLLAAWIAWHREGVWRDVSGWGRVVAGGAMTGLVFVYLPIAASMDPPLNMGDPDSWDRFQKVIGAEPYQRHFASGTAALALGRFTETVASLPVWLGATLAAVALGIVGGLRSTIAARRRTVVLLAIAVVNLGFASIYNILDNDGFFQPALIALALLGASGFDLLWARVPGATVRLVAAIALAALPATWTWSRTDLSRVDEVDRYARDMLDNAERGALILVFGDTQRAALSYLQVVEDLRPDVAVLSPSMLVPWHVEECRRRGPEFPLPPLGAREDPNVWLQRVLRDQLVGRRRAVYFSSRDAAPPQAFLDPELRQRADLAPVGLLYRVVQVPSTPAETETMQRDVLAEADRFWQSRSIPSPATDRPDPQLTILPVHYAAARFRVAIAHVWAGNRAEAEAHLTAIAATDVDQREQRVARAYRGIGRDLKPRRFGARARAGIEALRRGAPADRVAAVLSDG